MPFCDLHIHSTFSDGTLTPEEIVGISRERGLAAISITDHDTIRAVAPAKVFGREQGIMVLSGTELSSVFNDIEIHILGYLFDERNMQFKERLGEIRKYREIRAQEMVAKLSDYGCSISIEDVKRVAGIGAIGRPHVAQAMLERKCIGDYKEAFIRYIGNGKPCNVPKYRLHPEEAIALIEDAGGIPVLAHPGNIGDEMVVADLLKFPFKGIEVWHPDHSSSQITLYEQFAERAGLFMTGGSDCHGEKRSKMSIGGIKVSVEAVEALIEYKKAHL